MTAGKALGLAIRALEERYIAHGCPDDSKAAEMILCARERYWEMERERAMPTNKERS